MPYIAKCLQLIVFANEAHSQNFPSQILNAYNTYIIIMVCECA